jgi:hypothetical protein
MTPPVLFLIFNRPDATACVFEAIRIARPARLYVAADGPRTGRYGEAELCAETRRIATEIDWPCDLRTLFHETNLGCGEAVSRDNGWFFEQVPEGIILEDYCVPHSTFFQYCEEMLDRYRERNDVMAVCGSSYSDNRFYKGGSYAFTRVFDPWGWATWRRAWKKYDRHFSGLTESLDRGILPKKIGRNSEIENYWLNRF